MEGGMEREHLPIYVCNSSLILILEVNHTCIVCHQHSGHLSCWQEGQMGQEESIRYK